MKILLSFLFLIFILSQLSHGFEEDNESKNSASTVNPVNPEDTPKQKIQSPVQKYRYLFAQHRSTQIEAVKRIVSFEDNKRRYELVNIMLKQIFKTTEDAKNNVTSWGFLPGDSFPENITILEGVTKIFENTALFGDMVLRLPDIVHDIYDGKKEWQLLLAWAYGFCTQSNVFEGPNLQLLNLMAQEVNIIPQDVNYFNPYKAANREQIKQRSEQSGKVEKKKLKKKIQRGPRMSHTEL